jgi:hypothetical protein
MAAGICYGTRRTEFSLHDEVEYPLQRSPVLPSLSDSLAA